MKIVPIIDEKSVPFFIGYFLFIFAFNLYNRTAFSFIKPL